MVKKHENLVLRILCQDEKGIIAWITGLIAELGGNIIDSDQHTEEDTNLFAMRLEVEALTDLNSLKERLEDNRFKDFIYFIDNKKRQKKVAILVTKEQACLYELLLKQRTAELDCEIPVIISNRKDLRNVAEKFEIPFHHLEVNSENLSEVEEKMQQILEDHNIDLVVLARYMRILSKDFVDRWAGRMINIHHSFLPAFKGAKPYHQAWERGVKVIGATAHYVTSDLDEGPIIHQSTIPVSHRHSIKELVRAGRDIEKTVLANAVRAHLENRIVLVGKRTIVFY